MAGKFFIEGNVVEGCPEATSDNWGKGVQGKGVDIKAKTFSRLTSPIPYHEVTTESAGEAFKSVLKLAGASHARDAVDERIVQEARSGKEQYGASFSGGKKGIIDSPEEVGGWPLLKQKDPEVDSDQDGMPDRWEAINRLNPNDPADAVLYSIDNEYTNIEVWLNSLVKDIIK